MSARKKGSTKPNQSNSSRNSSQGLFLKQRSLSQKSKSPTNIKNSKRKHTSASILEKKPDYMQTFIKKNSKKGSFTCLYCSKNGDHTGWVEYADDHIETKMHENKTPTGEKEKLKTLKEELAPKKKDKFKDTQSKEERDQDQMTKHYLEFLAFGLKENFSFSQISQLGKFLQSFLKPETLKIFKRFSFDREEISLVSRDCFRECLLENLKSKLEQKKYSFVIDSATFGGESACALTAKHLETIEQEDKSKDTYQTQGYWNSYYGG